MVPIPATVGTEETVFPADRKRITPRITQTRSVQIRIMANLPILYLLLSTRATAS
ncbi:MAG: hypothetical protein K6E75_11145 [Lachnospiraceae bacterium]|nr:hypothetical protein [Lachnospiraceae bacterium]